MPRIYPSIEERFWAKVDKTSNPNGCWEWTAARVSSGRYGGFKWSHTRMVNAHRASMMLAGHEIDSSDFICHKCDNTICVNPDHLYVGTPLTNAQDKSARGRTIRGVDAFTAVLTPAKVVEIRALVAGGAVQREVAELYGVTQGHISDVVHRHVWAWVP